MTTENQMFLLGLAIGLGVGGIVGVMLMALVRTNPPEHNNAGR